MAAPKSKQELDRALVQIPGAKARESVRSTSEEVLQPAGNQASLAASAQRQTAEVDEQERKRWNAAMGLGREFDRLSPEKRMELSTAPHKRASFSHPRLFSTAASESTKDEGSAMEAFSQGVGTVGSWAVGHGEWNALQDVGASETGEQLAEAAVTRVRSFRQIADALDETDAPDRVALAFMESPQINTLWLDHMMSSEDGRYLLNRLYARLIEGTTGPIKGFVRGLIPIPLADDTRKVMKHASRIMEARYRAVPIEKFAQAASGKTKIFPYKTQGLLTFSQTPMDVRLSPEGKVLVELSTQMPHQYPEEYKTLPPEIVTKRVEIEPDEIVGIRLYDQGGTTIFRPAIFLLHFDQLYQQDTAGTVQLAAGLGTAVGGGGLSASGGTGVAKALLRVDLGILALSAFSKLVNEERWWLEEQGFGGVLQALDLLNSAAQIYGLGRLVVSTPQLLRGVHESYGNWRERRTTMEERLPPDRAELLNTIDDQIKGIPNPPLPGTGGDTATAPTATPVSSTAKPGASGKLPTAAPNDEPIAFDRTSSLSIEAQKQLLVSAAIVSRKTSTIGSGKSRGSKSMVTSADVPSAHVIAFLADKKKPSSAPPSSLQPQIPLHPPAGEQALPGSRNVGFTEQEIKLEAIESAITVETPVPGEQPDLRPVDSGAAKTPSETLAESAKKLAQQPPGPPEKFSLEVGKIHASMEKTNLKLKQVELELANLDIDVKRHEAEISAAKELRKEVKQGSKSDKNGKYLLDKMEEAKEKIAEGGSKKKELLKDKTILEAQLAKTLANLEIVVQNKGAYTDAQWDYAWALIERGESLAGRQKVLPTGKDITLSKPRMELASRNIEELLANLDRPTRDLVASLVPSSVPGGLRKEALENARTIRDQLLAGGQPVDVATGNAMVGLWEPDHLVSRNTIATDPRFQYLTPSQQREMLVGVAENMFPLAKELNGQKGDLTMAEWIDMRKVNNEPIYFENDLREAYRRAWDAVDRKFVELLGAERGKPPVRAE